MSVSTRRFSRGRITGLTLIAVLTLGLGYLHFAGAARRPSPCLPARMPAS